MSLISVQGVRKVYRVDRERIVALGGVSLAIEEGEICCILGTSGSGKSTLIKLLLKELDPSSGTIKVNGINLNKMKPRAIPKYRRKLGLCSHNPAFSRTGFASA